MCQCLISHSLTSCSNKHTTNKSRHPQKVDVQQVITLYNGEDTYMGERVALHAPDNAIWVISPHSMGNGSQREPADLL